MLQKFTSTSEGKIILSIAVWGLGLSALFRKACKGRNCIIIKGPKPEEMHNKIYEFDDKCLNILLLIQHVKKIIRFNYNKHLI